MTRSRPLNINLVAAAAALLAWAPLCVRADDVCESRPSMYRRVMAGINATHLRVNEALAGRPPIDANNIYRSSDGTVLDLPRMASYGEQLRAERLGIAHEPAPPVPLDSREGILARLEDDADAMGMTPLSIEARLRDRSRGMGSRRTRRALEQALGRLPTGGKEVSVPRLNRAVEDLYIAVHAMDQSGGLRNRIVGTLPREAIRRRIGHAVLTQNLADALQELHLIEGPTMRESLREFRTRHRPIEDALITSVINTISLWKVHIPGHAPDGHVLRSRPVPPALIAAVRERGLEGAMPELRAHFGTAAITDWALNRARALYIQGMTILGMTYLARQYPMLMGTIGMQFVTEEDLRELEDRTFNAERVRQEQFESWRQAYFDFEGHYPDPGNPSERAEMDAERARLRDTPDADLRVTRPE